MNLLRRLLLLSPQVIDRIASQEADQGPRKTSGHAVNMALQEYISRSGEQLTVHSVCGASLNDCYHINFLAYDNSSGSAAGAPVLFFTEAVILLTRLISASLFQFIRSQILAAASLARSTGRRLCTPCMINTLVYGGGREIQEDKVDHGSDFPGPCLDVDYAARE